MSVPERITVTVLVASLVLATSIPLAWALTRPEDDAGVLPGDALASAQRPTAVVTAEPEPHAVASLTSPARR